MHLQWDLSITDTLGPEKQFVIQRFPLFRGYLACTAIYLDPQKQSVIERFPLLGEFIKRGSTVCVIMYIILILLFSHDALMWLTQHKSSHGGQTMVTALEKSGRLFVMMWI